MPSATAKRPSSSRNKSKSKVTKAAGKRNAPAKPRAKGKRTKMVYFFGQTLTEGKAEQKLLLGGKGANLADMTSIGLPVPPGFTITTETCAMYSEGRNRIPAGMMDEVSKNIRMLERELGKKFGSARNPLLVSVRSGAAVSMPGMMDTILNLGLTDEVVAGMAAACESLRQHLRPAR